MRRSYLALQGTASPFFSKLAEALRTRGHAVQKVNFCGGDLLYGGAARHAVNYEGRLGELPAWYSDVIGRGDFTDVLMFGDCREVHVPAHAIAQKAGMRVHVFEEGYVRPHWLTLERHGVNGRSLLPRDPGWYRDRRKETPASPPAAPTGYNLRERAFHDIAYRGANTLFSRRFPHYRSHRPHNGFVEYAGLAWRALAQRGFERDAGRVTDQLLRATGGYFLFPLQLNSDAQLVVHSPFGGTRPAVDQVLRSFAAHADSNVRLVVKNHPLDTGLIDHRRHVLLLAQELGIADRVTFIDAGHLPTLLEYARGVIVVNSTVGLSALHHRRPLIALGHAIYDMQGLTWQGSLDDFWKAEFEPDRELYQAFLDYVIYHTQINGDFYTRTGIERAIRGAVSRLEASHD
ncbi:capsular biosynthesis protein [Burkholderia cenocepacia]|uniref:capsule biosynthesis protein n=1 Tax=Burkholderia cenocepacia TaxID=95486 RepID=UPI002AB78118|nr:capsular biosynthesis protein [Burkholderia cenocepacia]